MQLSRRSAAGDEEGLYLLAAGARDGGCWIRGLLGFVMSAIEVNEGAGDERSLFLRAVLCPHRDRSRSDEVPDDAIDPAWSGDALGGGKEIAVGVGDSRADERVHYAVHQRSNAIEVGATG